MATTMNTKIVQHVFKLLEKETLTYTPTFTYQTKTIYPVKATEFVHFIQFFVHFSI